MLELPSSFSNSFIIHLVTCFSKNKAVLYCIPHFNVDCNIAFPFERALDLFVEKMMKMDFLKNYTPQHLVLVSSHSPEIGEHLMTAHVSRKSSHGN